MARMANITDAAIIPLIVLLSGPEGGGAVVVSLLAVVGVVLVGVGDVAWSPLVADRGVWLIIEVERSDGRHTRCTTGA